MPHSKEDAEVVKWRASLPLLHRLYETYCRLAANRATGHIPGGRFLLVKLIKLTKALHLRSYARTRIGHQVMWLDLYDTDILTIGPAILKDNPESRIMKQFLKPGDTFLDIGANHGVYSMIAAPLVGAAGKVLACEPQPRLAAAIRKSFKANRFKGGEVYAVACSDREGETEFYIPLTARSCASLHKDFAASLPCQTFKVHMVRLDDLSDWQNAPGHIFLKLDVEGNEVAALKGAKKLLEGKKPVILFEANPQGARAAGGSVEDILKLLQDFGYERFIEVENFPQEVPVQDIRTDTQQNVLVLPT